MRRGFSLMEVLVGLAILTLLLGSMMQFFLDLHEKRDRLLQHGRTLHATGVVIDQLEDDLAASVAGTRGQSGIEGSATSLTVHARRVIWPTDEAAGRAPTDLVRARYTFEDSRGVLRAVREDVLGEAQRQTHIEDVKHVRFRYHDGRRWQSSFDTRSAGALPHAVEVAIWLEPAGNQQAAQARSDPARGEQVAPAEESLGAAFDETVELEADPAAGEPDRIRVISVPGASDADEGGTQ